MRIFEKPNHDDNPVVASPEHHILSPCKSSFHAASQTDSVWQAELPGRHAAKEVDHHGPELYVE